jgi:hypothetical protein
MLKTTITEEKLKNITLAQFIPLMNYKHWGLYSENIKIKDNIYLSLVKAVNKINGIKIGADRSNIYEIDLNSGEPVVRALKDNPSLSETVNGLFTGRNINLVIVGNSNLSIIPTIYIIPKSVGFDVQVGFGMADPHATYPYEILSSIIKNFSHIRELLENIVTNITGYSDECRREDLIMRILLFFVENNDKIEWYITSINKFLFIEPYIFLKPISLHDYNGKEKRNLDELTMVLISGDQSI